MSKHSKHKKEHHKGHDHKAKAELPKEHDAGEQNQSMLASLDAEAEPVEEKTEGSDEGSDEEGVFRNVAELNGKKSGGHEPVSFIPPNPPMDHSAQASLDAHEAAGEDKDPSEVQQELSHKEILEGALDPSSPPGVTKDLPDDGKNPDAAVASEAPADEKKSDAPADAGQAPESPAPTALTQPSSDGSEQVSELETAVGTDQGATPSAS